jgi:phage shock protein PspC (stress-responsive transcriptional regulator)
MTQPLTHTPQIKRLERSSSSRVVAGVSGGLGRYFDLNPAVFRLGFVVLTLLGGAGLLVYLAAVLVIPAEGSDASIAAEVLAERRDRPWPLVGLGLIGVATLVLVSRGELWPSAGAGWFLLVAGGLVILWTSRRGSRGRRIAIAATVLLTLLLAAAVTATAVAFAWFNVSLSDGVGDRTYAPVTAAAIKPSYEVGIGDLRVDLSRADVTTPTRVKARVGLGHLKVIVPHDADVSVDANVKAGELHVLGQNDDGRNASITAGHGRLLTIDARAGAGRVDVVRAP